MSIEIHTILGVRFKVGSGPALVEEASVRGGLVVVPSAPVLVGIAEDAALRDAVLGADMAITDSGLMVLLWKILTGDKLERVSGLEYLTLLLARAELKTPGSVFWVMPTAASKARNLAWLRSQGFPVVEDDCYVAPMYGAGALQDESLLAQVKARNPRHIILCLGGGVQERIGYFLRNELRAEDLELEGRKPLSPSSDDSSVESAARRLSALTPDTDLPAPSSQLSARVSIHCIGAAIGFLTGDQVRIPMWVDYLYLGWLWRICSSPKKFFPRYWKAIRLVGLMIKYRERAPVAAS